MAYDTRKSDMGKWVAPVQANRKAETLDFAPAVSTPRQRRCRMLKSSDMPCYSREEKCGCSFCPAGSLCAVVAPATSYG